MYKKRSKFRVDITKKGKEKRTFEGILFDSELEMKYYRDYLLPLKEQGFIKTIILQPKFQLLAKFTKYGRNILPINYVADFEVAYSNGTNIIIDVKGLPSAEAKLKRKLFDFTYPDKTLEWVSLSVQDGGWLPYDDLVKLRNKRKKEKKGHASPNI